MEGFQGEGAPWASVIVQAIAAVGTLIAAAAAAAAAKRARDTVRDTEVQRAREALLRILSALREYIHLAQHGGRGRDVKEIQREVWRLIPLTWFDLHACQNFAQANDNELQKARQAEMELRQILAQLQMAVPSIA
jgi:type II secretory pathway pseudopilin PulG